jgi:hypothetical protein
MVLAGHVALCWAVGEAARRRGRSQPNFTVLSFFITPLIGYLVLVIASPGWSGEATGRGRLVRCPVCAEWIQPAAVKCRFCGAGIGRSAEPPAVAAPAVAAPAEQPRPKLVEPLVRPAAAQPAQVPASAPAPMQETDAQAVAAPPIISELHILLPPPPTPTELETLPLEQKIEAMRHQPANQHPLGFYEKTKDWLRHESPEVRGAALRYLAQHCRQHSDAETHLKMVVDDPDTQVRATAAECLGGIFRRSRNREANAVLAAVTRNQEEEGAVRAAALAAIRRVNGY